jgi:hypothetical protein
MSFKIGDRVKVVRAYVGAPGLLHKVGTVTSVDKYDGVSINLDEPMDNGWQFGIFITKAAQGGLVLLSKASFNLKSKYKF